MQCVSSQALTVPPVKTPLRHRHRANIYSFTNFIIFEGRKCLANGVLEDTHYLYFRTVLSPLLLYPLFHRIQHETYPEQLFLSCTDTATEQTYSVSFSFVISISGESLSLTTGVGVTVSVKREIRQLMESAPGRIISLTTPPDPAYCTVGEDRVRKLPVRPRSQYQDTKSLVLSTLSSPLCLPRRFSSRVRSSPTLRLTIIPVL